MADSPIGSSVCHLAPRGDARRGATCHTTAHLAFAGGTLTLQGISPALVRRVFDPGLWTWDDRCAAFRCDAQHYATVRQRLATGRVRCVDEVCQWTAVDWPRPALPQLRAEQTAAVRAWRTRRSGTIVMPTGTGKTEVALAILQEAAIATLVVAPVRDLMYQWHRRILSGLGYDAGSSAIICIAWRRCRSRRTTALASTWGGSGTSLD